MVPRSEETMTRIVLLLLLQTGVIPVLSQRHILSYQNSDRYSNYGDFNQYESNAGDQQRDSSVGLQQSSFFSDGSPYSDVSSYKNSAGLVGGENSYGGLTPPPPPSQSHVAGNSQARANHYYRNNERRVIVPSSLRELEESYIRSLSSPAKKRPGLDPYMENRPVASPQQRKNAQGVENYSGFIMTDENGALQVHNGQQLRASQAQQAPITYGFPLLTKQISASNSIDGQFGRRQKLKQRGKVYDVRQKNIVPTYPDFGDRPPIPQEPDIPPEDDAAEEATRKPPIRILPTPPNIQNFYDKPSPSPLASPPPIFDPTFPEPIMQRGFIPSFGPPTKEPYLTNSPQSEKAFQNILNEHNFNNFPSHAPEVEVTTTSPVPVLRPTYPMKNKENILPDEVSSATRLAESEESSREGTVYKHISVHVPAEELDEELASQKVIKVIKKPEKHIKVIFIKPPDTPTPKTEVEVPSTPHQKTLVYVLSESGGVRTPIKLVTPNPLKPAPPQVFFLRYRDPNSRTGQEPPREQSSPERETTSEEETDRPRTPPPIKQLAHNPDAELLRSAPTPALPTFSSFSNPPSTAISRLALQTLNPPTVYSPLNSNTNSNYENNGIGDPTNSRFQGTAATSTSPPSIANNPNNNNNNNFAHLQYNTNSNPYLPPSRSFTPPSAPQQNENNPFPQNYYTTLYHLYPPPISSPNLFSLYSNQINHPQHPHYYPHLRDRSIPGPSSASSSIQGLYTVAPYLKDHPGSVNFNYLLQNPDGKNLPRIPRNFAMMTYAPTYMMPSASGTEQVPVFTSPAEFIKSLLGDSYMYYNNIGNNSLYNISAINTHPPLPPTTTTSTTTTTTTTTTPAPPPVVIPSQQRPPQNQAQHHTLPLIFSLESFQNLSRDDPHRPLTVLIGHPYGLSPQTNNANIQIRNPTLTAAAAVPINLSSYSQLVPPFQLSSSSTTTTTTPPPRISWAPPTTSPPPLPPLPIATTRKQIIQLPLIIYDHSSNIKPTSEQIRPESVTNGVTVSSHFNNLFRNYHQNPAQIPKTNQEASKETSEISSELNQSDSSGASSDETRETQKVNSSGNSGSDESGSGEEIMPIYFEATKQNYSNTSSIIYVKNDNNKNSQRLGGRSGGRSSKRTGRKRVNPAHVKPGRRLRKVKKPPRNNRKNNSGNNDNKKETTQRR